MLETFSLLVKLAAMASIASVLARSNSFKGLLMGETRTLNQRVALSLWLSSAFGVSVAIRVFSKSYPAADLGLEGSLIAGILGGYVTGLASGVLISLPAMLNPSGGEQMTMPLLAAVGVLGGVLRDLAPDTDEIWRFTPFFDLNVYRFFKESRNHRRTAFHLEFTAGILVAEFLRQLLDGWKVFSMNPPGSHLPPLTWAAIYASTLFAVPSPEDLEQHAQRKLQEQERLLAEARLAPHQPDQSSFSLQHLNSVSSESITEPAASWWFGLAKYSPPAPQTRELQYAS
jgi:two-component system LytT family sensor kinase